MFRDPHVLHRGMLKEMPHPTEGTIKHIGIPVKLSETPGEIRQPAPLLGQDNEEVLGALGINAEGRGRLRAAGVI